MQSEKQEVLDIEDEGFEAIHYLDITCRMVYKANAAKGFWDKERNVGELLMLVTSELGEALEAQRKGRAADIEAFYKEVTTTYQDESSVTKAFEKHITDTFEDEIADAVIRLFDMCGGLGIDLGWHIENKLMYNAQRPKLHGKKF